MPITSLAFLIPGNFADEDPYPGLEDTLQLYEYGERTGFDGAWIRQRHLEHGVGSAAVFLAAAGQRTDRVELGTAVIPIGYENPFRLAEDLALADVLSQGRGAAGRPAQGRLQVGFSTGMPHADLLAGLVYDGDWRDYDLSYGRIARVVEHLRGGYLGGPDTVIRSPGNVQGPGLQRHAPGLASRIWYGGGSLRSIRWAATSGLNLLTGNIVSGETSDDFATAQLALVEEYRKVAGPGRGGRIALGRVVVPFDSASPATRVRYRDYVASRTARTRQPQGPRRTLFAPDVTGTAEQILEQLSADPVLATVSELRLELPYEFSRADYEQILHDVRTLIAPELGWQPQRGRPLDQRSPRADTGDSMQSAT